METVFKGLNTKSAKEQRKNDAINFLLSHKIIQESTTVFAISRLWTGKTRYASFLVLIPYSPTAEIKPFYVTRYIADILQVPMHEKRGYFVIGSSYSGDIAQDTIQKLSYRLFQNEYKLSTVWL